MSVRLRARIDSKRYDAREVLAGVALEVAAGEILCVAGPSGAGKSTLVNLLAGVDSQFEGRLCFDSTVRIGVMFQQPRLLPWLTVTGNLLLVGDGHTRERVDALLAAIGLEDQADTYPSRLSLGMQRRVALARALLPAPQLLLLDEPFVSLDAPTAERMRALLVSETMRNDSAVVLCTHDLNEAVALGDRIMFLGGRPAHVALEERVDMRRPRGVRDARVENYCRELLRQRPGLLAGNAHPERRP